MIRAIRLPMERATEASLWEKDSIKLVPLKNPPV